MEKEEVEDCYCGDNKGEEKVKGKESSEGGVIYGEATSDSFDEYGSYIGDGGEEVSNDGGSSE